MPVYYSNKSFTHGVPDIHLFVVVIPESWFFYCIIYLQKSNIAELFAKLTLNPQNEI